MCISTFPGNGRTPICVKEPLDSESRKRVYVARSEFGIFYLLANNILKVTLIPLFIYSTLDE